MFKKRLLALAVAVFALVAVVGAGFSAWVFTDDVNNKIAADVTVTTKITEAITDAKLTIDETTKTLNLTLDDPKAQGITVDEEAIKATFTVANVAYNAYSSNIKYYANVYVKEDLAVYVAGPGEAVETSDRAGYKKYVVEITSAVVTTGTDDTEVALSVDTADLLTYTSDVPTTFAEYQAMVAAAGADDVAPLPTCKQRRNTRLRMQL